MRQFVAMDDIVMPDPTGLHQCVGCDDEGKLIVEPATLTIAKGADVLFVLDECEIEDLVHSQRVFERYPSGDKSQQTKDS